MLQCGKSLKKLHYFSREISCNWPKHSSLAEKSADSQGWAKEDRWLAKSHFELEWGVSSSSLSSGAICSPIKRCKEKELLSKVGSVPSLGTLLSLIKPQLWICSSARLTLTCWSTRSPCCTEQNQGRSLQRQVGRHHFGLCRNTMVQNQPQLEESPSLLFIKKSTLQCIAQVQKGLGALT